VLGVPGWLVGFLDAPPKMISDKISHFAAEWRKFRKATSGEQAVRGCFVEGIRKMLFESRPFA
jgi:hypothetical protein